MIKKAITFSLLIIVVLKSVLLLLVFLTPLNSIMISLLSYSDIKNKTYEVAVVLGARVYEDGELSCSLQERVERAIEMYNKGRISKILMTGGQGSSGVIEAQAMKRFAVRHRIPSNIILTETSSHSTMQNLSYTKSIVEKYDLSSVVVISSAFHTLRIKFFLNKLGLEWDVTHPDKNNPSNCKEKIPKLVLFYNVVREYLSLGYYQVFL